MSDNHYKTLKIVINQRFNICVFVHEYVPQTHQIHTHFLLSNSITIYFTLL